jgi:hypothetical protein
MTTICNKCCKDFKYLSYLKRHENSKKGCKGKIHNDTINDTHQVLNSDLDINNILKKFTINREFLEQFVSSINIKELNELMQIIQNNIDNMLKKNTLQNETQLNNTENIENIENTENKNNACDVTNTNIIDEKKYICTGCNHIFKRRQGLYEHKNLNRCKGIKKADITHIDTNDKNNKISLIDNEEMITPDNFVTEKTTNTINPIQINNNLEITNNNNNITNNITNNQTILVVNPFGFVNLDHIKKEDVLKIGSNAKKIFDKLIRYIYKNKDNKNFFKYNMNKSLITYLSDELTIENINEEKFYIKLKNILVDNYIYLLYKHKNDLNFDEIVKCTFNLLKLEQLMKNEEEYKKEVDAIIYELCDTLLRDKDTNKNITCIINELDNDIIIKKNIVKTIETKKERKQKAIKEYVTKPEDNNSNALNLYNIRQEAHADLIEYNTRNAVCNV